MAGFTLSAAASIAAGLSIGAAATVGVTLALDDHSVAPAQEQPTPRHPSGPLPGGIRRPVFPRALPTVRQPAALLEQAAADTRPPNTGLAVPGPDPLFC